MTFSVGISSISSELCDGEPGTLFVGFLRITELRDGCVERQVSTSVLILSPTYIFFTVESVATCTSFSSIDVALGFEVVGLKEGFDDGASDGFLDENEVGEEVGVKEGIEDGSVDGFDDGASDGTSDGASEGFLDGNDVGKVVGVKEGFDGRADDGVILGTSTGIAFM